MIFARFDLKSPQLAAKVWVSRQPADLPRLTQAALLNILSPTINSLLPLFTRNLHYSSFPPYFVVELRKQLTGFETSLLTCNRKAAVKIRARIAQLKEILMECVRDGIQAKITYTDALAGGGSKSVTGNVYGVSEDGVNSVSAKNKNENEKNGNENDKYGNKNDNDNKNDDNKDENGVDTVMDMSIVDRGSALLLGALSRGRPEGTIEETWERMILAEKMRFDLDVLCSKIEKGVEEGKEIEKSRVGVESVVGVDVVGDCSISSSVGDSAVESAVRTISCSSSKYASYVNLNYSTMKRLPSVVKA